ncbi:hypothetical protein BU17DRAFT_84921 [Hysterangium stoloniferum]|nr:hypothetical protein BU17DRAFT_84921 [Hysterangium stoloniferum]
MSTSESSTKGNLERKVKYKTDDPRLRPSSSSPEAQATFLRRLGQARASQPPVSKPGRVARVSSIISNIAIPGMFIFALFYCVFLADWGPDDHVFAGPQLWFKRQTAAFWSVPPQPRPSQTATSLEPES